MSQRLPTFVRVKELFFPIFQAEKYITPLPEETWEDVRKASSPATRRMLMPMDLFTHVLFHPERKDVFEAWVERAELPEGMERYV